MIRDGLCKIAPDRRDYSLLHTWAGALPDPAGLPADFTIYDGRAIPNQNRFDDRFSPALRPIPMGCTGETTTFNAGLEDDDLYDPVEFYFATPPGTDYEGRDIRVALSTAANRGFLLPDRTTGRKRAPYFNCYGAGKIDDFDAARIALWLNQAGKVGVSVGLWWYREFANPVGGSLPLPSFDVKQATLHNVLVTGWRTLADGTEELEVISWQGMDYGDKGRVWLSRVLYNALMAQPWTGAFTQRPLDDRTPATIGIQAIIDHLVYYVRQLFGIGPTIPPTLPPNVVEEPAPTPVKPRETPSPAIQPPKYDWSTPTAIRHSMRTIGDEYNMTVLQKDLLCDICSCESGFNIKAKLVNTPKSIDRGLFQINSYYHPDATDELAYDPEWSTRWACKAILARKAHTYWSASEKCWNRSGKYTAII